MIKVWPLLPVVRNIIDVLSMTNLGGRPESRGGLYFTEAFREALPPKLEK